MSIKIKSLVWEYHPAGAIAAPPTGFAYIIDSRMKGRIYSIKGFNPQREFSSMEEAKAAAQSDYETRIRSALEPCDPLGDPRVVALYDALYEIRDMLWSRPDISDRLRPLMGFAEEATNQKAAAALAEFAALSPTGGNADG